MFRILAALPLLVTNSDGQKSLGTAETNTGDRAPHGIAAASRRMRPLRQETYPIHIFIFAATDPNRPRTLYGQAETAFKAGKVDEARRLLLEAWGIRHTYDVAAALGQAELAAAPERVEQRPHRLPPSLIPFVLGMVVAGLIAAVVLAAAR